MSTLDLRPRAESKIPNRWSKRDLRNLETIENTWNEQFSILQDSFQTLLKTASEKEYVLRSQIAFLFSLFDFILHEIVKLELVNMFAGRWEKTPKYYKDLVISIEEIEEGMEIQFSEEWFLAVLDRKYNTSSLCHFEKMCQQFGLIGISKKEVADEAFYRRGSKLKTEEQFRNTIIQLNDLRNPIVHQASLHVYSLKAIPIQEKEVEDLMVNLNKIVCALIVVIRRKMEE